MKKLYLILLLSFSQILWCHQSQSSLQRVTPEDAQFSSAKLKDVEKFLEEKGSAAFLALYEGKMFFSWGNIQKKYPLHSIRKPLLGALYGIYVKRGVIDLNKTLKQLKIDDIDPKLTESEKGAKVIDLLKSKSGVYHAAAAEAASMLKDRPERGSHQPGTFFYYNNWDFNALGTIFEQATEKKIFTAFYQDIAKPIGMKHYKGSFEKIELIKNFEDIPATDGFYQYEKQKSIHPAYHFQMSSHDLALFGLLYMNKGTWKGKQIIPAEWITNSTTAHSPADPKTGLGYGMLWNVLPRDEKMGRCFLHTGNGVHLLAVFPDIKIVIVHRVDTTKQYGFTLNHLFHLWDLFFKAAK
jgi:CubicO group peptidase (beta-lactamase class C family)